MKHFLFIFSFVLFFAEALFSQNTNTNCSNPSPFCTGQTMSFPAQTGNSQAQPGPAYGCLGSQPRPTWFYFQAATAGPMVITMAAANDIDFIAWGPFLCPNSCTMLTSGNQVPGSSYQNPLSNGCSFSGSATETLTIANTVPGQFYILLITNYSGANQNITFQQANANNSGAGTTNCNIICMITATNSGLICTGNTATLSMTSNSAITSYTWLGPNNYTSNLFNSPASPTISSTYTIIGATSSLTNSCNQAVASSTCKAVTTITVIQYPSFTITPSNPVICQGGSVAITTALQLGSLASSFTWQPFSGAGVMSPNSQNTVIYPPLLPTNVTVATIPYSLTVSPSILSCPITKTIGITINNPLTPSLTMPPSLCDIFSPVTLSASPGGGTWTGVNNNAVSPSGLFNPALANFNQKNQYVSYAVSIGTCVVSNFDTVFVSLFNTAALTGTIIPQCVQDPTINLMSLVQSTVLGSWSGGPYVNNPMANFFNPSGLATGNYSLVYNTLSSYDPTVCPSSTVLMVSVFNPVTPLIRFIKPVCNTAPQTVLTATPANGVWSIVSGVTASGILTPSSAAIGNNTVSYSAGLGTCVATSTTNFNVSRFNTAALTGTMPNLCVTNNPFNLMSIVQSSVTGIWSGPNVISTYSFDPGSLTSNTYILTYNTSSFPDPLLCPDMTTIAVSVLNPTVPNITLIGPFCNKAAPIQMSVSPNTGSWTAMPYLNSTGLFSPGLSSVGGNPVQYVIGTSTCNAQQTKFINVEAFVPSTIINNIPDQCVSNSPVNLLPITLYGSGTWGGNGVTAGNFNPAISGAGTHILTYSTSSIPSGMCPSQSTLAVNVFSLATPVIDNAGPFCSNSAAKQLMVSPVGGIFAGANTAAISNQGVFNPAFGLIGDNIISYSIASGPCIAFAQASISVEKFVSADFATDQKINFCQGDLPVNMFTYVYNPTGIFAGVGIDVGNSLFDPAKANVGINKITYQTFSTPNATLCPDTKTINVTVNETPTISLVNSSNSSSCAPVAITMEMKTTNQQKLNGYGYWNIGDGSDPINGLKINHTFTAAGVYTVLSNFVTDKGCSTQALLNPPVTVFETPKASFIYEPDVITLANPEVYLNNTSSGLNTNLYQWSVTGMSKLYEVNPKLTLPQIGVYKISLTATSINGCKDEASKIIEVKNEFNVFIPNSFSPNNDGLNDVFKPVFSPYGLDVKTYELEIFNRWGQSLFRSNDPNKGWDGTAYNIGITTIKQESYIYNIKFKDLNGKAYSKTGELILMGQ